MGTTNVSTTALSLARELWRFGEPELAERAFVLTPVEVAEAGRLLGAILDAGMADVLWPDGPRKSYYLLGAIALLEGSPRPAARRRRLAEKQLPSHLQATEEQRWAELSKTTNTSRPDYLASGWPVLWTQPAIDTATLFIGSDTQLELSMGPLTAWGGTMYSGFVYREGERLRLIYDFSGRVTVLPGDLPRGPVQQIRVREPGRRWQVAFADPKWVGRPGSRRQ